MVVAAEAVAVAVVSSAAVVVEATMQAAVIEVAAVERLSISPLQDNRAYLRTKRDRLGHDLLVDTTDQGASA